MFGPDEDFRVISEFGSIKTWKEEDDQQLNNGFDSSYNWFNHYIEGLNYSTTATSSVKALSSEIGNLIAESTKLYENKNVWGEGRLRKGMVVGSIQSGKTASMMGVIGKCIDEGTEIVILLSGTKISLWHQTLTRLYDELDNLKDSRMKANLRLILPREYVINNSSTKINYSSQEHSIRSAVESGHKPLIFVIPKITAHIYDVASVLHRALEQSSTVNRHILVIDDESDDASILDAEKTKTIPYAITRLWAGTDKSVKFDTTANEFLFSTYLAYTATPQANVLQVETNPLAPTDFLYTIDTPGKSDSTITYFEPEGIRNYYTGGDIFYEQDFSHYPKETSFVQDLTHLQNGNVDFSDGLRAYIVGAAINLLNSKKLYSELPKSYHNLDDAQKNHIEPFSMVFHPSADTPEHFEGKQQIVYWLNYGTDDGFVFDPNNNNNQLIDPLKFRRHFSKKEKSWKSEIKNFKSSIDFYNNTFDGADYPTIDWGWSRIKDVILDEIIPHLKIRVINSKAGGESRPKFSPIKIGNEFFNAPDKLSIFVAGNVLSRGLTIEGLAVSVFARSSLVPVADTQMQMQRWFGYRGKILPLCRIFLYPEQLVLFREYHQADKTMKERISKLENNVNKKLLDLPYILEGNTYHSTAKTATSKLPIRPFSYPQFGILESDSILQQSNLNEVLNFLKKISFSAVKSNEVTKGYVSNEPISSIELANLLDSLEFSKHRPSIKHPHYRRWEEYADVYSSTSFVKNIQPKNENEILLGPNRCPYTISAFLRFWNHVSIPENSLKEDLYVWPEAKMWRDGFTNAPDFFVTLRSGSRSEIKINTSEKEVSINAVKRGSSKNSVLLVDNVWGTASGSANQFDDKLFDYHKSKVMPVPKEGSGFSGTPDEFRPSNHPGQIAIYFIEQANGSIDLGFGIAIPAGSPEHIRSMRG